MQIVKTLSKCEAEEYPHSHTKFQETRRKSTLGTKLEVSPSYRIFSMKGGREWGREDDVELKWQMNTVPSPIAQLSLPENSCKVQS